MHLPGTVRVDKDCQNVILNILLPSWKSPVVPAVCPTEAQNGQTLHVGSVRSDPNPAAPSLTRGASCQAAQLWDSVCLARKLG